MSIQEKHFIPLELQNSNAIVAAWIDKDGGLINENMGFHRLIQSTMFSLKDTSRNVTNLFIQPTYNELIQLVNNSSENCYNGIFTLGKVDGICTSIKGKVVLQEESLYLNAEHDIDELENLQQSLLTLNQTLARTQKKLTQMNQTLESRVKERTLDLEESLKLSLQTRKELSLSIQDKNDILDSIVDGIISIDENGVILSFNAGAEKLFGYKAHEIIDKNIKILMPNKYSEHHDHYIQNYLTTGIQKIIGSGRDVTAKRKNGSEFPMHLSVAEMSYREFDKRRFIGSCLDLTEFHQQQDLLRRSQKMDALGMLTGGIAHDFNNMLGVILGFSELIKESASPGSNIARYVENIFQSSQRGAALTRKLLSFSRSKISDNSKVNINQIVIEEQNILEKTLTPRIQLKYTLDDQLWSTCLDKNDFEDALINICINAMHAITGSGTITIKTENRIISTLEAQFLEIKPGEYALLSVSDTGKGIDEETMEKIFDPFFTTKGDKGTGLGLSQVFGFAKRSNGTVNVESQIGEGTTFTLYFPRYEDLHKEAVLNDFTSNDNLMGTETLLLVDDEQKLLELYHEILSSKGYKLFSANSPELAIDILNKESIDLVISDIVMPNINGYELAEIIKEKHPLTKVQLMSGFAEDAMIENKNVELHKQIIIKPFEQKTLLKKLREILD